MNKMKKIKNNQRTELHGAGNYIRLFTPHHAPLAYFRPIFVMIKLIGHAVATHTAVQFALVEIRYGVTAWQIYLLKTKIWRELWLQMCAKNVYSKQTHRVERS